MSKQFVQTPAVTLYTGLSASGTSMVITPYPVDIQTGTKLTFADFGDTPTLTVDPKIAGYEEIIQFSSMVDNGNNTATLAIAGRNLIGQYPYTTTGTGKTHGASAVVVFSDNPQLYNAFVQKTGNETVAGIKTFTSSPIVPTGGSGTQAANNDDIANAITGFTGKATDLVAGTTKISVPAASPTNPIAVGDNDPRVPTQGENDALVGNNTDIAVGTGNKFVTQTGLIHNAEKYVAVSSASSTAYTATLSPVVTSQTDGMEVYLKMDLANTTTTPTLAVNGLTARTIVKTSGLALAVGDIAAGMMCNFRYDATNTRWVMMNPVATPPITTVAIAEQNLVLNTSVLVNVQTTTNSDGSILISSGNATSSGTSYMRRYIKDTNTGQYIMTHSVDYTNGAGAVSGQFIAIVGNYIYLVYSYNGTSAACTRFDLATLANATVFTISGTNWGGYGGFGFSDGTFIYASAYSGSIIYLNKYSISGTVLTYISSVTYTGLTDIRGSGGAACDGVNVWFTGNNSGTQTIQKYPLAGGAVTSTTTYLFPQGIYDYASGGCFLYSSSVLGISYGYGSSTPTALAGMQLKLNAVTLP